MLRYKNISQFTDASHRLKNGYRWISGDYTQEADQLTVFTSSKHSAEDSEHNLNFLLDSAKRCGAPLVVLKPNLIQFVGQENSQPLAPIVTSDEWRKKIKKYYDSQRDYHYLDIDLSTLSECASLRAYGSAWCLREHQGIYDVETRKRMTNRQEIIQAFWDHGFAAWRGRPMHVAKIRWSGTREDLEMATEMADRYWSRKNQSNVAKKFVQTYTSINRYAAWPGSW